MTLMETNHGLHNQVAGDRTEEQHQAVLPGLSRAAGGGAGAGKERGARVGGPGQADADHPAGDEGATAPDERAVRERGDPRVVTVNRQQSAMRIVQVEGLVEADHPVRAIWEFVGRLDLRRFYGRIEAVEGGEGRPAWDPRMMIGLWAYAYSRGVSSAREVSRLCEHDPAYQWLTGLQVVNHHSLSDFRVTHKGELEELFTQMLGVLSSEGLITLERVMHDGTKIKAWASGNSFRREGG